MVYWAKGNGNASDLIEGLRRLEYRGYDSAGIAVYENGKIEIEKKAGQVRKFGVVLSPSVRGNIGIGHTRCGQITAKTIRCECPSPWG